MRWVVQESEFTEIFLRSRTCVYIDSGREPTPLIRLTFDDAGIRTEEFANLLQKLMECSRDPNAHYAVLEPDPVHYFYRQFKKYPVAEIAFNDSSDAYLSFLNEDPGGSPADAIGINWSACVVVPPSLKWFVHALRSAEDDSGHLWIPPDWVDETRALYPFLAPPRPFQNTRDSDAKAEIRRLAAAIAGGDLEIVEGCRLLVSHFRNAGLLNDSDALTIVKFESETTNLPARSQRVYWNPDALAAKDAARDAYVTRIEGQVIAACQALMAKLHPDDSLNRRAG
jgi:hypothetical protein